ncbi:uncharacterized protein B0H18DRAFT_1071759, partial [Fomitopsis serialis]|uniref:uncharacterized protein n=1 Tax=Fomitopsis serialis TaxID=139415 RepID=UPI0020087789
MGIGVEGRYIQVVPPESNVSQQTGEDETSSFIAVADSEGRRLSGLSTISLLQKSPTLA